MSDQPTRSRQQYLDLKARHPDAILFFRLGDFYEMFDEDAVIASQALDLVLTARHGEKMCGVPHHAVENYIAKMITRGFKVAVAEQLSDLPIKGLMPRDVVRVFTPGTVIEAGMLQTGRPNYLAAIVFAGESAGIAYADITTGVFATTTVQGRKEVLEELARLDPAELLVPDTEHTLNEHARVITRYPVLKFEESFGRKTLAQQFGVKTLTPFGCDDQPLAIRAAGAILAYLQETQKGAINQIQRLSTYQLSSFMALDRATRRNLELTESLAGERKGSLLAVLDSTVTPMGARLLHERVTRPLLDPAQLETRYDEIEALAQDSLLRADLRKKLRGMGDLERLTNRVLGGKATPRDLEAIKNSLETVPLLHKALTSCVPLYHLAAKIDPCEEVVALIGRSLNDSAPTHLNKIGVIKEGYSAELDGITRSSAHARDYIATLEPEERRKTGIESLKVGFNKVFGYYIEISRGKAHLAPEHYIRKQTLVNAERFITPEMKEYETLILNAEERILEIERRLFQELCQQIASQASRLLPTAAALAQIDVAAALAEVAINQQYVRPILHDDLTLIIAKGRHPVVERGLSLERFVPNDTNIGREDRIHIITGPNMSGKSTYLRQVALIVLMAQIGSFVPAESAEIGLVDRIFTRIGAHDELHAGRSTFMVEMVETAEILHNATRRSLLILDEIGRGTSTYDGLSIAWAILEYLHNHPRLQPRTLFATHYHELVVLADTFPLIANYNVAVAESGESVTFLHHIIPGGADQSYGIHVAQLAGLPRDVINRAQQLLGKLEESAPNAAIAPSHLKTTQQIALFPAASPLLTDLQQLDVLTMTPLEALNKLYEWKRQYGEKAQSKG